MVPDATVTAVNGSTLRVELRQASAPPDDLTLAERVAAEIVRVAYFSPGGSLTVAGIPGRVTRVAGPTAEIQLDAAPVGIEPGASPEIVAGARLIAIRDFELLGQINQEDARALLEEVTTHLARTGQFRLVERSKLDAVLAELNLSLSDLAAPDQARRVGQLLTADIIVTGTLFQRGDTYSVNLRLISFSGEIYNAVATAGRMVPVSRTPGALTSNIEGSCEAKELDETGWEFGRIEDPGNGRGGYREIDIDPTQGAAGSSRSLRIQFAFGEPIPRAGRVRVAVVNLRRRDLSRFRGATFYLKADPALTVDFHLWVGAVRSRQDEHWVSYLRAESEFRQYRVQWPDLVLEGGPVNQAAHLDLTRVAAVGFRVLASRNRGVERGTLWADKVSFF
jgi:TolB-like protein